MTNNSDKLSVTNNDSLSEGKKETDACVILTEEEDEKEETNHQINVAAIVQNPPTDFFGSDNSFSQKLGGNLNIDGRTTRSPFNHMEAEE